VLSKNNGDLDSLEDLHVLLTWQEVDARPSSLAFILAALASSPALAEVMEGGTHTHTHMHTHTQAHTHTHTHTHAQAAEHVRFVAERRFSDAELLLD
jgi:hypothetical protein